MDESEIFAMFPPLQGVSPKFHRACLEEAPNVADDILGAVSEGMQLLQFAAGFLGCVQAGASMMSRMKAPLLPMQQGCSQLPAITRPRTVLAQRLW
jgi:hypothetical protein